MPLSDLEGTARRGEEIMPWLALLSIYSGFVLLFYWLYLALGRYNAAQEYKRLSLKPAEVRKLLSPSIPFVVLLLVGILLIVVGIRNWK